MNVAIGLGMMTQGTQPPRDRGIGRDDKPGLAGGT